jgi:hypothetical protein
MIIFKKTSPFGEFSSINHNEKLLLLALIIHFIVVGDVVVVVDIIKAEIAI